MAYYFDMLISADKLVDVIRKAAEKAGGAAKLAKQLGVSRQAIDNVTSGRSNVPYGKIPNGLGFRRVVMFERVKEPK